MASSEEYLFQSNRVLITYYAGPKFVGRKMEMIVMKPDSFGGFKALDAHLEDWREFIKSEYYRLELAND